MKVAFVTALLAGLAVAAPSREVKAREEAIAKRNPLLAAEIGYGIVGGAVYYIANKILSSKRSAQSYEEVEESFAASVADSLYDFAHEDEASLCVRTGGYDLSDDIKTRALATVQLKSATNVTGFDCFLASGNGNLTITVPDDGINFSVNTGLQCNFEYPTLTCTA